MGEGARGRGLFKLLYPFAEIALPTGEGKNNGNKRGNMTEEILVKTSSGNVFADLGLVNPDELLVKAELTRRINQIIQQKNISNEQLSVILNIDKSQIADLIKGKITEFYTGNLFKFLNILGYEVCS